LPSNSRAKKKLAERRKPATFKKSGSPKLNQPSCQKRDGMANMAVMKRYFALLIAGLVMGLFPARAQGPDDLYVRIYNLIQEADSLNNSGQASQALTKYLQAQKDLQRFQIGYPDWNAQVVKYRLNYLTTRIAAAPARVSLAGAAAPNAAISRLVLMSWVAFMSVLPFLWSQPGTGHGHR